MTDVHVKAAAPTTRSSKTPVRFTVPCTVMVRSPEPMAVGEKSKALSLRVGLALRTSAG
jgi:hypothetical protein